MCIRDRLIGVTCCFGNVTVDKAVQNTLRVLRLFGAGEIPVYAGAPEMFTGKEFVPNEVCKRVHGLNGIGEIELPEADKGAEEKDAAAFMAEMAQKYGKELVIVATAAMTNLARFITVSYTHLQKQRAGMSFERRILHYSYRG